MNSLLFGIALASLFSITSLITILLRVSPLTAPVQALSAFFLSAFLSVTTSGALILYLLWKRIPLHTWDTGQLITIALRQGVFLGLVAVTIILFQILQLLTWWIAILIFAVVVLIELALWH